MIEIKTLASSSAGNAYTVTDGNTTLLLEAGIHFRDIQRAVGFRMSQIAGCLISHEHGDHRKAAADLAKAGVEIYASQGTLGALQLPRHRTTALTAKKQVVIGSLTVLPFDVRHDAEEPLGFLLGNQAGEKLLFATDTYYIPYRFPGLTHIMVECNYSEAILDSNIIDGRVPAIQKKRLQRSHFSLENFKDFIRANDMSKVQEIHLLHLSDRNSDEAAFKRELQELTGKPIYIAER
ncbi:MBL fold metallo-hydrolase [Paenibacillus daejeonensis]|uniref:MBL fold metallo-hydrolase n=1 Tax=Paenibacillus daejeonensis TaxID=135193 RepID=UPI00036FCD17|nr:MBL fold metallo-hydrolase [Paenibacillus daejeonensis]